MQGWSLLRPPTCCRPGHWLVSSKKLGPSRHQVTALVEQCLSSDALKHLPPQRWEDLAHLGLILSGVQLVLQAAIGDGRTFDALALGQDRFAASEIDIGRRQVLQAFDPTGLPRFW